MDSWSRFWKHNKPLHEAHIKKGFTFKKGERTSHFVDNEGNYASFPIGYITGVGHNNNGTPTPYYASVYLGESGWAQRSFATIKEAADWALDKGKQVLAEQDKN